jgi:hypothetical protein
VEGAGRRGRLESGDRVIRRHRWLKTVGTVLRFDGTGVDGAARAWIRWDHRETLPNPSLEPIDDLEVIDAGTTPAAGPVGTEARAQP